MLRDLAHKHMSENKKCSAFKVIIKSLRVDRGKVENPKVVLFAWNIFSYSALPFAWPTSHSGGLSSGLT